MKTTLISVLSATLMGFAVQVSGRSLGAAEFTSIIFAAGLLAWTIEQYNRQPAALTVSAPIRLPLRLHLVEASREVQRLAA